MARKLILLIGFPIVVIIAIVSSISILPSEKNLNDPTLELNKEIPEVYEFGNFFDNGLKSGMTSTILNQGNQKASIRFTNSHTGLVSKITLSVSSGIPQHVIIGLQEDDGGGNPSGEWLNGQSIAKTIISRELESTFTFPEDVLITEKTTYHIVIEPGNINKTNSVKIKHYQTNTPHQPFNPSNPDNYLPDSSINSLYFDGTKWIEQENWPSFFISFKDGQKIGQPYTLAAGWVIRGSTWVGQTFIPSSDYNISEIGFVVNKEGEPDKPLFYGIQDSENNILSTGIFTESKPLSFRQNWIEISLDEMVFFESGKLYRIYLYSPIPRGEEFYRVFGHEYSFNYDIGYGELTHRLTISHDEGKTWSAWNDADTIFKLRT